MELLYVIACVCAALATSVESQTTFPAANHETTTATTAPLTSSNDLVTLEPQPKVKEAVQRALQYLVNHREPDWGWGNNTHNVILAIQLANNSAKELEHQSLEMQLSAKQMEIEILLMMSKHHETPPSLTRLASYTLTLGALCKDPRSFHHRDLVAALLHREPPHDVNLDFAHATLAACSAAGHVRKKHIRRLLDIANNNVDHHLDTIAMVILALRCIVQDHRHRNYLHFVRRPIAGLARQQQADGGFGAVITTALAIQALEEEGEAPAPQWSLSRAQGWLLARQGADGGWGDVPKTAAATAALAAASLAAVRPPHCRDHLQDRHDTFDSNGADGTFKVTHSSGTSTNQSDARNVSFTYTLWLGTNVTENHTLYMVAPKNISFFHVMQLAAQQDPKFEFEASEWPNGHYVHTLAGHKEEPMAYNYWLLYRLADVPDPTSPPGNQLVAPVGVDELLVEEGEHYLFWYKKL